MAISACVFRKISENESTHNFCISEKCKFQKVGFSALVAKIGLGLPWCLQESESPFHM